MCYVYCILYFSKTIQTMKDSNKVQKIATKSTRVRPKVQCRCKKCSGKLVEVRTRKNHEMEENRLQAYLSKIKSEKEKTSNQIPTNSRKHSRTVLVEIQMIDPDSSPNLHHDDAVMIDDDHDQFDEEFYTHVCCHD